MARAGNTVCDGAGRGSERLGYSMAVPARVSRHRDPPPYLSANAPARAGPRPGRSLDGESVGYWDQLRAAVLESKVTGPRVHDARVAVLCLHHGVDELWSADRDFGRFAGLKVRNPLVS